MIWIVFGAASGWGGFQALRRGPGAPGTWLCALQLSSIAILAAVFFGTLRLRSPYDPYVIILALPVLHRLWERIASPSEPSRAED